MSEHVTHAPHDETAWVCLCGNTGHGEGFTACGRSGIDVGPDEDSDWDGLYRCDRCQRIIDQTDLRVVGTAPQCYRLTWQGIEIEARYWPRKWGVTAHVEVESIKPARAALPITGTGYR